MNEQYNYSLGLNSLKNNFRKNNVFGEPPPDYVPGKGRGAVGFASGVSRDDSSIVIEADFGDYSDTKFDKFSGFNEVLFKNTKYDDEDKQADSIYNMIDEKLGSRRKVQREKKLREEIKKMREHRPTIQQQFLDLKRSLRDVKLEEWDGIPESNDYMTKNKKTNYFVPIPDHVIDSTKKDSIESLKKSSSNSCSSEINYLDSLNELGTAKGNILSLKLDKAMDNVSGQSVIDSDSYLSTLNSINIKMNGDVSDIKKARLLLKSIINTNPKHAPGWIAAARFEEVVGRISHAREILNKGCDMCPKNEDIWLESIRLGKPCDINKILSNAIKNVPNSTKIWLEAANRETTKNKKLIIVKKALEIIPNSLKLWKEAISLVDPESERHLLTNAVKCVPQYEEFWLKLASISSYNDSQRILNEARRELPTNPGIWVAAAKLEESVNKTEKVEIIIKRCISNLSAKRFVHSRTDWLEKAVQCEKDGFPCTCNSIIKNTIFLGNEENVNKNELFSDIDKLVENGNIVTSRAVFEASCLKLKAKKSFWMKWADFEEKFGGKDRIDSVLQESLKHCPGKEVLWLKAANNQAINGNIELARFILSKGYTSVRDKEQIILAAVKLENSQGETQRARTLLERERTSYPTINIWIESIQLERKQKNYDLCISYCSDSVKSFSNSPELWLLYGKVHNEIHKDKVTETVSILEDGVKYCPKSVDLWLAIVDLLIDEMNWKKARTVLDLARSKIKGQPELWIQTIQLERKAGNNSFIPQLISKALKECPKSGLLYAESIFFEPEKNQRSKYLSALELCENDPYILSAIATLFWKKNDNIKARNWFERAIEVDNKLGDTWLNFITFELLTGNKETQTNIIQKFLLSNPEKGFEWNKIKRVNCSWDLSPSEILIRSLQSKYNIVCSDHFSAEIKSLLGIT
ncbi:Pre-mRNA splicing factor Pro1/Prp6 HAT repeat protein [Cryptosporidium ryanae]|uniref:Pre-mRNA splicing factor Pro1/Prp6 HAT repeat protein n=1 Tax=Cryptosporidium ryanae TaxID=515981 RepID=UPI00351A0DB9|nr:Pre-mRNA splicing factor Pro1/Prp6 HAT repeat protein [Cryptosporidium ryanae]